MRLWLAAVGRARPGPARSLYEDYAGRITWPLTLREVEVRKALPPAELTREEGRLLLAAVPEGALVVALDERGEVEDSDAFARRIGGWRDSGVGDIAFLIGGADGHDDQVRRRARRLMAFGPMTWPHMLVRALLAEQLYRAQQILAGHPYHRR